jgi:N utilization substance protein B
LRDFPSGLPEFDPDDVVDHQVIEPPVVTNEKSLARRAALQVLYEVDSAGHPVGEVLDAQLAYTGLRAHGAEYARRLVNGVLNSKAGLDRVITHFAPEWPVEQVAIVDRNVLRIAVFEMAIGTDTPVKVAIDEAVELAKLFGADGTPRFVNGVLGAIAENADVRDDLLADATEGNS